MENNGNSIGRHGEDIAAAFLQKNDYKIISRNFNCRYGELDIVAFDRELKELVFVEVKTRTRIDFGLPAEFVNSKKQNRLRIAVHFFLSQNSSFESYPKRMDIIEVLITKGGTYLRHIKNAF